MATAGGPNIVKDGLVFGYDTNYGVADNITATRFYPGEPTTNSVPLEDFIDTSNWTGNGWSGALSVSTDYPNTLELTATNGWRTYCINTGITSGGTVTVSYEYKAKSIQNATSFVLNLNGTHLGSHTNGLGNGTNADIKSREWIRVTKSWTANSDDKFAIGVRGSDGYGLSDTIYVRNLQVELNGHATPFTATSRTATASLIDLKETIDIDVSNVSFDSTGQPDFDGTGDFIKASSTHSIIGDITLEGVFNEDASSSPHTTVICTDTGHQYGVKLMSYKNSNRYGLWLGFGSSSYVAMHAGTLDNNTIYHLVGSWQQTTGVVKIYLNGVLKSTLSTGQTSAISLNEAKVVIGADYHSLSYGLNGKVYVGKVYQKVLTATEVKQNYNAYKNRFDI
jgi:hypothetical protein